MTDFSQAESRIELAIQALQAGKAIILKDDEDRENEADLVIAAETMTVSWMAKFIRYCSGIVCLCLPAEKLAQLNLPQMVPSNENPRQTGFTLSIEARTGVTTGVSAADRLTTIQAAIAPNAEATDLVRPGHVFPLRAVAGGVLARRGHTEGSVDLVKLAGLTPAAVLCELMNDDGTMMIGQAVEDFSRLYDLPIVTVEELAQYLMAKSARY